MIALDNFVPTLLFIEIKMVLNYKVCLFLFPSSLHRHLIKCTTLKSLDLPRTKECLDVSMLKVKRMKIRKISNGTAQFLIVCDYRGRLGKVVTIYCVDKVSFLQNYCFNGKM